MQIALQTADQTGRSVFLSFHFFQFAAQGVNFGGERRAERFQRSKLNERTTSFENARRRSNLLVRSIDEFPHRVLSLRVPTDRLDC